MKADDFQLASTALRVLPGYEEQEFVRWYRTIYLASESIDGLVPDYAIIHYDFNQQPALHLSSSYDAFSDQIISHLKSQGMNIPWGSLDSDVMILKLVDEANSRSGRVIIFHVKFIAALLKNVFPQESITPAELKTLLQSLCGLTLKEAAGLDGVSYETKKSQLKSVFQKTGIRRQSILSSFLISHLLLEVAAKHSRSKISVESDEMFFEYVDRFMGRYVRASVVQEPDGSRFRLIEIGDPCGTPVVCIHHLGLINFTEHEINEIFRQGIRLICPLRHGAMGPHDQRITASQHLEHALAGINLAASLIPRKKVTIIGMLSGCLYATQYLKRNPNKVDNMIFFGASYKPVEPTIVSATFKNDLHEIASSNRDALSATLSYMLDKVDQVDHLKKVVEESHNNGAADIRSINEIFSDQKQVKAMQFRLKYSMNSIAHDLQSQAVSDWRPLRDQRFEANIHFIHGSADELIPIQQIEELVSENINYHLHIIEEAGNWLFGEYTNQTFAVVRSVLDNKEFYYH